MMRLLWVWVFVGVVGAVLAEKRESVFLTMKKAVNSEFNNTAQERSFWETMKSCEGEKDEGLCRKGFFFTATALSNVRDGGELEVLLSVEGSLYPHVTFDLSLLTVGDTDLSAFPDKEERWKEKKVVAREQVILEVNELRKVVLRVSDLQWRTADLVFTAHPTGHSEFQTKKSLRINKVSSDVKVFLQTDKPAYAPGDTVGYRVLVVDGNVDKTPKFAQVILTTIAWDSKETRLPWVEVPENGILRGNFTLTDYDSVRVRVTSNATSSDFSVASTRIMIHSEDSQPSQWMSVRLEVERNVSLSQPRVKGHVKLTSAEGIPLEGNCDVTVDHYSWEWDSPKKLAEGSVAVGEAGGEFHFDLREQLEALPKEEEEFDFGYAAGALPEEEDGGVDLKVNVKCSHLPSGSVGDAAETILLRKSLFRVVSVETLPEGNSSHPQSTVVLNFLVDRRDGGSVEEEEPSKGLRVKLLLSEENLGRLRPSATNFSLPIPPNGRVRLEFQVSDTHTFRSDDRIRMEVGDAEEETSLEGSAVRLQTTIHVTPIDRAQLIRRGDVVRFRVRSCVHYASLNAILSSANAIYSSRRFLFSPHEGQLDEVIELTIPQNVTEGSLILTVYGSNYQTYSRSGSTASLAVNVIPSSGPQYIKIVDQVDVDMSTVVTFRLEGTLADSVVSLQAAKLDLKEGEADEGEEKERQLMCRLEGYVVERENPEIKITNDSPDTVEPDDLAILENLYISRESSFRSRSLTFIDVDRATSTMDNGTLTVTKTFDRWTEFGTYVVSGATFDSKSGRIVFSNSPVLKILPPPVTLSVSVAPSVVLGETLEVLGYVKNNLASPFEGLVTLESSGVGSTGVSQKLVEIKTNSYKILKLQVTPGEVGDIFVSLRSNISSRLTATKKVKVISSV